MARKIRIGIIGANPDRGWAATAHIPALKSLPDFEIAALSTTRKESAAAAGKVFGVPHVFDNYRDLVACADVDVVVVAVKVPQHRELASAAIAAGKAVYCEWPLGNGLAEAEQLAALARDKGVLAVVGLQARAAPAIAYLKDLIKEGYVGDVLSTSLIGSGMNWGAVIDMPNAYTANVENGATLLSIPLGHTVDALCDCLGEFRELSATMTNRRRNFLLAETGEVKPMTTHDQVCVSGLLENGIAASIHYRGGVSRGTNLLWEINGTEGDLRVTAAGGHAQIFELTLWGGRDADTVLKPLDIPARYRWASQLTDSGPALNVAQAYARFAKDFREGSHLCPTFDDAVTRHRLLHSIELAAAMGMRQSLS